MSKSLSVDLRERVVGAVESGASRRQAALRFGVSISSAIRRKQRQRETGDVKPKALGGDRWSGKICSSVNRFFFIVRLLLQGRTLKRDHFRLMRSQH